MSPSNLATAYFGRVESIANGRALGWAWLPRRPGYPPLIHALDRSRIVASAMVSPPSQPEQLFDGTAYRFDLNIGGVLAGRLPYLSFIIGETEQDVPLHLPPEQLALVKKERSRTITVEDLLGIRGRNVWIRGATYLDAVEAGLALEEIIDMLYRDYLGRPADPPGLEYYLRQLSSGESTYNQLRYVLVRSPEFEERALPAGVIPGSFFSEPLIYGPTLPLPGAKFITSTLKVSVRRFAPLWGDGFIRAAYAEICRAPIAEELRKPLVAMLDRQHLSKHEIIQTLVAIGNAISPVVELLEEEQLKSLPARRHHEIPLSVLLRDDIATDFVENAYAMICGQTLESSTRDRIVVQLQARAVTREEVLLGFVAEAHAKHGIPAVIAFDQSDPQRVIGEGGNDEVELDLDEAIVGYGWYRAEQTAADSFRWMPEAAGLIIPSLSQNGGDVVLRLAGYAFIDKAAVDGFACSINGVPIEGATIVEKDGRWSFTSSPIERRRLHRCYPYILSFRVSDEDIEQTVEDPRFLTVAIAQIRLGDEALRIETMRGAVGLRGNDAALASGNVAVLQTESTLGLEGAAARKQHAKAEGTIARQTPAETVGLERERLLGPESLPAAGVGALAPGDNLAARGENVPAQRKRPDAGAKEDAYQGQQAGDIAGLGRKALLGPESLPGAGPGAIASGDNSAARGENAPAQRKRSDAGADEEANQSREAGDTAGLGPKALLGPESISSARAGALSPGDNAAPRGENAPVQRRGPDPGANEGGHQRQETGDTAGLGRKALLGPESLPAAGAGALSPGDNATARGENAPAQRRGPDARAGEDAYQGQKAGDTAGFGRKTLLGPESLPGAGAGTLAPGDNAARKEDPPALRPDAGTKGGTLMPDNVNETPAKNEITAVEGVTNPDPASSGRTN
jgi:hypothetical protein